MMVTPSTPRRSTRGTLFTPSPSVTPSIRSQANTSYSWTSAPLSSTSLSNNDGNTRYNSYSRIISRNGSTPLRLGPGLGVGTASKKVKAGKGDEESRFTIGDGVLVAIEGGDEGVGVLIGLWEDQSQSPSRSHSQSDNNGETNEQDENADDEEEGEEEEEKGPKMMAEIHWAFRKQDLPGIMKNVNVEDNEVLLAASISRRAVTSIIPIQFLIRTIPIYSKSFYRDQFPETEMKSKVKGWSYIRQGIYWCHRAFDKFAKGGKHWKIDIDLWRENGKKNGDWNVNSSSIIRDDTSYQSDDDGDQDDQSEDGSVKPASVNEEDDDDDDDEEEEEEDEEIFKPGHRKRKRPNVINPRKKTNTKTKTKSKKSSKNIKSTPQNKKRKIHPKSSSSNLPLSVLAPEQLPIDPYQRALRLLHVGATPESLPCREEEFVDVLSRVEDGVESGGGGCLYIAGVPGTGKTATVHAVVKELKRKAEDGELQPFSYVEINGLKIPSPQHAYVVLWEAISGAKGASAKTALRGLESHFGRKTGNGVRGPRGHTFVVLMDELDQLLTAKQDVVYNFFNWPTMRDSQLFVVAVANRMDLPQHLAAKIKSRIGLQTILFQPYDRTSLISIVQSRLIPHPSAPSGDPKVLLPDAIALAATKMAGTNGDARRVLDACRRAVEVALEPPSSNQPTSTNMTPITNGKVNHPHPVTAKEMMFVLQAMSASPVSKFIGGCSIQQKIMLASLVRCIRREGIPEIIWRNVRSDHDVLCRSGILEDTSISIPIVMSNGGNHNNKNDDNDNDNGYGNEVENGNGILLSNSELSLVLNSLISSHALIISSESNRSNEERKIALGMEVGEVGRVLMNQGESWRRALAGV
ncbi:uncharacterized protein IL334_005370 [Kwoniella shivajii]|uniref:Origin recognition complex subunit 1 n=1 Tax=Kwoniella shivajii TaxID=564305 RepID=A0ABZ1D2Z5_9TREE|nr:hypothetical protein IL334_005370 [Kwoniella shivajii]